MKAEATHLKDCYILHNSLLEDKRGYFFESFSRATFLKQTGLDVDFVQDNQSSSAKGVLRGLHFQTGAAAQAKLVRVLEGEVLDIAVDLRKESPTFGQHVAVRLSPSSNTQLFIPRNFAHGFIALSERAVFFYKCDNYYNKQAESGLIYDDPDVNINWLLPKHELILSEKDLLNPTLKQIKDSI